ncbi:SH3-domain-containing protein [Mycena kentingensis (nom. inval.)]|nr:SH3-domain-containing protein [Mycena kentingensis (nom. inval.)]
MSLLDHVLTQTRANIHLLQSLNKISPDDARIILDKLPLPASTLFPVRAIWGYNQDSSLPDDLSFRAGEIIDIIAEPSPDWWTGRLNGRHGRLPANYVERLPQFSSAQPARGAYSSAMPPSYPMAGSTHFSSYAPPPSAPYGGPAPYGPLYTSAPPPQQQPPPPNLGPPPPIPQKESKLSGLGNTFVHSTVGGAGFAVGSGIVNSIF